MRCYFFFIDERVNLLMIPRLVLKALESLFPIPTEFLVLFKVQNTHVF